VHRVGAIAILGRQFRNAVLLMLLATAVIAAVLGDALDAGIITVILLASTTLGFANEYAAERTSKRLRTRLTQTAMVVRDGSTYSPEVSWFSRRAHSSSALRRPPVTVCHL